MVVPMLHSCVRRRSSSMLMPSSPRLFLAQDCWKDGQEQIISKSKNRSAGKNNKTAVTCCRRGGEGQSGCG
jgi:hypothetical protein